VTHGKAAALGTVEDLRRQFDAAFAAPSAGRVAQVAAFLALRIDGDAYALRVEEIRGFAAARKIVPIPASAHAMLGLAGIRGVVVPVFSLRELMGYARGDERPRWFVLCGADAPIALAFDEFDGYLELPQSEVRPASDPGRTFVREMLRDGGALRGVVALASMTKTLEERAAAVRTIKER
jgi:chemotaxis signal transduction protein